MVSAGLGGESCGDGAGPSGTMEDRVTELLMAMGGSTRSDGAAKEAGLFEAILE